MATAYEDEEHGSTLWVSGPQIAAEPGTAATIETYGPHESADGTPIPQEKVRVDLTRDQALSLSRVLVAYYHWTE